MSKPVNPFAPPNPHPPPNSDVRWGIAASAPPMDAHEVETPERAIEVILMWGDEVLHVAHVRPSRSFVIGEAGSAGMPDYSIGRDVIGAERLPVVIEQDGKLCCVIPEGASGAVKVGDATRSLEQLEGEGKLTAFADLAGARLYPLPDGATARVEHRGLTFLVKPTHAARAIGKKPELKLKHTGWIGLSLSVHAIFLVLFYYSPPHTQALSLHQSAERERMIAYLSPTDEGLREPPPPEQSSPSGGAPGEESARAAGDEGQAGDPEARPSRNRMAIARTRDDAPALARENIRENLQNIAAIGTVRALLDDWNAPTSPFERDRANGMDAMNALGALMGEQLGANAGYRGLGMRGTGRGAGGQGDYIGLNGLSTKSGRCGTSAGCGPGFGPGSSGSFGPPVPDRLSRVPRIQAARAAVTGALSPEAIRRVVRRHLPEIRHCYEQGLHSNPSLEGRVTVRWMIAPDGRVQAASIASSDLRSAPVESCITTAVQRWTFPNPEGGGVVGVNYPFVLQSSR